MQTSQLAQLHVALIHCHFYYLYYIPTSFDIASFFIENLHFSLISFANKSRLSEFFCVFLYYMIPKQVYKQILFLGNIFCESFSVISFSVFMFSSSNFSVVIAFVYSLRLLLFNGFVFFFLVSFLYVKIQYATTSRSQSRAQTAMEQNGP